MGFGSRGRGRGGVSAGQGSVGGPSDSVSQCDPPSSDSAPTSCAEETSGLAAELPALK